MTRNNLRDSDHSDHSKVTEHGETIRVAAPAMLDEGYTFDVIINHKPFTVTVPLGGVMEGEEFDVVYTKPIANVNQLSSLSHFNRAYKKDKKPRDSDSSSYMNDYDSEKENSESGRIANPTNTNKITRKVRTSSYSYVDDEYLSKKEDNGPVSKSATQDESDIDNYDTNGNNEEENLSKNDDNEIVDIELAVTTTESMSPSSSSIVTSKKSTTVPPSGHWRHGLFTCCEVVTQATFWMSFFCLPVLMAQVVTRLQYNYMGKNILSSSNKHGQPNSIKTTLNEMEINLSFNKIVLSFVAVLFICNLLPGVGIIVVAIYYFMIIMIYLGKNVRHSLRKQYNIPPSISLPCYNNTVPSSSSNGRHHDYTICDDCLCMTFCGCCSLIQIARHTHNDKEYPGYCCTTTGLEMNAPIIVANKK